MRCRCVMKENLFSFKHALMITAVLSAFTVFATTGNVTLYVAEGGTGNGTIDNPMGSIQAAVIAANESGGGTVLVQDGTYIFTTQKIIADDGVTENEVDEWTYIDTPVIVKSISGKPQDCIIDFNGKRGFNISNASAVLSGFRLHSGIATTTNMILMAGGEVNNCLVADETLLKHVSISATDGAVISNCAFTNNIISSSRSIVSLNRSSICDSKFIGNGVHTTIMSMYSSTMENCEMHFNNNNSWASPFLINATGKSLISKSQFNSNDGKNRSSTMIQISKPEKINNVNYSSEFYDCEFDANKGYNNSAAFWTYYADVKVYRSVFANNEGKGAGLQTGDNGGIYFYDCLIVNNLCTGTGPGVANITRGVYNCTIYGNKSKSGTYQALNLAGNVYNTIIWGNGYTADQTQFNTTYYSTTIKFYNSCYSTATAGNADGNISEDPMFNDPGNGDFTLSYLSPCLDAAGVANASETDICGNARPIDGNGDDEIMPDMGCYEMAKISTPIEAYLQVVDAGNVQPAAIKVRAKIIGLNIAGVTYKWYAKCSIKGEATEIELDNGYTSVIDPNTAECTFAECGAGEWSFRVVVENQAGASVEAVAYSKPFVGVKQTFVAVDGADVWPYDTPAKAAKSFMDAINLATTTVTVGPGEYVNQEHSVEEITQSKALMICNKPLRIESSDGCENTIINCDGEGGVVINHKDAVFTGFTLTNFAVSVKSPALYLKNGLASNLVINCYNDAKGYYDQHVYIAAVCAELTDSIICGNNKPYPQEYTYVMNATLKRVKFINNKSKYTIVRFGNVASTVRSKLYDCEFINNSVDATSRGLFTGYEYDPGADMYRCKFIGNTVSDGPIMSFYGHTVNHCIFADNNCKDMLYMPNNWGGLSKVRNTLMVNNTVKRNVIRKEAASANSALEIENVTIAHNTSSDAECAGVYVKGQSQKQAFGMYNTIVFGNRLQSKDDAGNYVYTVSDFMLVDVNDYYEIQNNCYQGESLDLGVGNISADPKFVSPMNGNFALKGSSPCIGTGAVRNWTIEDKDVLGNARLSRRGRSICMGAIESARCGFKLILR